MLEIFYTFKKYWEVLRQEAQEGVLDHISAFN